MRKRKTVLAFAVGTCIALICSTAFLFSNSTAVSFEVGRVLGLLGLPAIPGVIVGMILSGNAHTGGPLKVVMPAAIFINAIIYGFATYLCLRVIDQGRKV